jgi:membrane protein DedA with SNARE-associated domain
MTRHAESIPGSSKLFREYSSWRRPFTVEMAILFLATFASEDLACISAGVLVAHGRLTFVPAILACFFGIFAGDVLAFLIGRVSGRQTLNSKWLVRWIAPEKVSDARQWLARRGSSAVFISRFTPGLRVATYFSAGFLKMRWWKFVLSLVAATAIWVPLIVSATELVGDQLLRHVLNRLGTPVVSIVLSFVLLFVFRQIHLRTVPSPKRERI